MIDKNYMELSVDTHCYKEKDDRKAVFQTEDKVHGARRGFFYVKVSWGQYSSGIEALFLL